MRDLAYNWDGVAYDTGKPIRIQEQVIRIVPNTTTLKAQYNLESCMLHPPIYSREDLRVQDAQDREELAVVIGELLPLDFDYDYPQNLGPTQNFDFGRHDLIIPTQDRVGYVIETFSGSPRQCFLLFDERFNGVRIVKRLGGLLTTEIRDRLFYYHEFSKCEARTKVDRWGFFLRKIKAFRKSYLENGET